VIALLAPCLASGAATESRPNIVLILADDLGWSDLGVMGSRYNESPNIDRLAARGLTFTSYYVSHNCAPSRAALVSGQYAPRTGVYTTGHLTPKQSLLKPSLTTPVNNKKLPLETLTVAQMLKRAGYVTGMFGKWHLGGTDDYHPSKRGFDEAIVTGFSHYRFRISPPQEVDPDTYLADFLTEHAVGFMRRHKKRPFFLYLSHFLVHDPYPAGKELIDKFRKKDPARTELQAAYAAMIYSLDEAVGHVIDEIARLGLTDRTLILFASDNGGQSGNAPLRGRKSTLYEGGIRVPFIASWPGKIASGERSDQTVVHVDLVPTLLDVAGADPPEDYPLDGVSLAPLFRDPDASLEREAIYWHVPGYVGEILPPEPGWSIRPVSIIRAGDFKLFEYLEGGTVELYDLARDPGERRDLAGEMPELSEELRGKLAAWRRSVNAAMPGKAP